MVYGIHYAVQGIGCKVYGIEHKIITNALYRRPYTLDRFLIVFLSSLNWRDRDGRELPADH